MIYHERILEPKLPAEFSSRKCKRYFPIQKRVHIIINILTESAFSPVYTCARESLDHTFIDYMCIIRIWYCTWYIFENIHDNLPACCKRGRLRHLPFKELVRIIKILFHVLSPQDILGPTKLYL